MSLLALQTCLARLYLEPEFRTAFFQARNPALDDFNLTADERAYLSRLDQSQVERFARSLRNKRLGALRGRLPALVHAAGDRFSHWFETYGDAHSSAPEGRADALAFTAFLVQRLPTDADLHRPAYLPDLVRLERIRLELLEAARSVSPLLPSAPNLHPSSFIPHPWDRPALTSIARLIPARFDFERLFPRLAEDHVTCPPPQPSWLLLAVVGGTVRIKRLTESTTRLLHRCDGSHPLSEILAALPIAAPDRPRFEAECVRFLEGLEKQGLIVTSEQ